MKATRKLAEKLFIVAVLATAAVVSFECSSTTSGPSSSQGTMNMYMTDAPALYDAVWVNVIRVECHKDSGDTASGWIVIRSDSAKYNLLTLRNGARVLLGSVQLAPGHYSQVRLILGSGNTVVVGGVTYDLTVPSGTQTGIKLTHDFDIVAGQTYELLLDFDADASIHLTGNGKYMMNPVIRLVTIAASGNITGTVQPVIARASVWTTIGADTVRTVCDTLTGAFTLSGVIAGTYNVRCTPSSVLFRDTTITNVSVAAAQTKDIGVVVLSAK